MFKRKKLITCLLTACIMLTTTSVTSACNFNLAGSTSSSQSTTSNSDITSNQDSIITMEEVYAQAQSLGYEGSLEEFRESIRGKDGVGIRNVFLTQDGNLIVSLTDGTMIEVGNVKGKDGVSIVDCFINSNGHLILRLTNGESIDCGNAIGNAGANGQDGVGIKSVHVNTNGELIVTLTDESVQNLGNIRGQDGANGSNGTNGKDGVGIQNIVIDNDELIITLSNNTVLNLGNVVGKDGANGTNGKDGDSVSGATINQNGELVLTFVSGKTIVVGNVVGKDGSNGTNGKDGQDGVGVSSVSINNKGELVVTLTNGTSLNLGNVVGKDGANGANGIDGIDGKDGVSVSSASINPDGELVFTLSNGDTLNVGKIIGTDGENGIDGVGIQAIAFNEKYELVITLTSGESINCGKVPSCAHSFSDWTIVSESTCTSIGVQYRTCEYCLFEDYDFTKASGHAYESETIDATCAQQGYTVHTCSTCNYTYQDAYTQPTNEHTWEDLLVISSSCTEQTVLRTCSICNKTQIFTEKADNHRYEDSVCTECGNYKTSEGLTYKLNTDGVSYSIIGIGTCTDTELMIPATYETLPVTCIEAKAFMGNQFTKIILPNSITYIGKQAFSGCSELTEINIPNSVTSIGEYSFQHCTSLTSVSIGNGITNIGDYAFDGCTSLTEIYYNAIDCGDLSAHFIFRNAGRERNGITVTISSKVKRIPENLFYVSKKEYFPNISSVVFLENSVCESIGSYAFMYCSNLTSIAIPDSVTSIGTLAFSQCKNLTNIVIGKGLTSLNRGVFSSCSGLTSFNVHEENIAFQAIDGNLYNKIGTMLVYYASGKTNSSFIIPDSVTSISDNAFYNCDNLTEITISDSVTSIGDNAFYNCDNLTEITIPDSVTSIGSSAFIYCSNLAKIYYNAIECTDMASASNIFYNIGDATVTIGENVKKIPADLFSINLTNYEHGITSVVFEEGSLCESIGKHAFYNCTSLTSITIPDSVTSIGNSAFYNCTGLTKIYYNAIECADILSSNGPFYNAGKYSKGIIVTIGKNVKKIPASLFKETYSGCHPNITSIVFEEDSVCESIGNDAFYCCSALTEIVIPESVTSIGEYAFYRCKSLTSVIIPNSVTTIGNSAFNSCDSLASVIIPNSVVSIGERAFVYCDRLTIYCEVKSKPNGWVSSWNSSNRPVVWGYTGE